MGPSTRVRAPAAGGSGATPKVVPGIDAVVRFRAGSKPASLRMALMRLLLPAFCKCHGNPHISTTEVEWHNWEQCRHATYAVEALLRKAQTDCRRFIQTCEE